MKVIKTDIDQEQEELNNLVIDMVRLGAFSSWSRPLKQENIDWFNTKGYDPLSSNHYTNNGIVIERINELISKGAKLNNLGYFIANINQPEILDFAFKNGADPNIPGNSGITIFERSISKNRTKHLELLINNPLFNLKPNFGSYENVLFTILEQKKYDLATTIILKNPELIFEKDSINNSTLLSLSKGMSGSKNINKKALFFAKKCLEYADNHNHEFSVYEANKKGQAIISFSDDLALIITEHNALHLSEKLKNKSSKSYTIKI